MDCEIVNADNGGLGFVSSGMVRRIGGREGWIGGEGLGVKGRE